MEVRGRPVLADQHGVFGSPFADSARTRIRPETVEALVAWFTLSEYSSRALRADIETYSERLTRYEIGQPGQIEIVT
jgi:DNA/RNA-binding domain of Phe-tRNA-synthetase-like protein